MLRLMDADRLDEEWGRIAELHVSGERRCRPASGSGLRHVLDRNPGLLSSL